MGISIGVPGTGGGGGGEPGAPGKSAYQIAVDEGFVGNVTQWLASLKGEAGTNGTNGTNGAAGAKGDKGDKGDDGDPGANGLSAYEIAVENDFSGTEEEWLLSLVGPQGDQGIQGIQGAKGDDGDPGPAGPGFYLLGDGEAFDTDLPPGLIARRPPA